MYLVPVAKVQKNQILHAFFSEKRRQGDKKKNFVRIFCNIRVKKCEFGKL